MDLSDPNNEVQKSKSLRRILSWISFEFWLFWLPKKRLPRPDAIIVSCPSPIAILNGLRLRRQFNCRLVYEVRDIWPLSIISEGGFSPRNPLVTVLALCERIAYRRADLVVGLMPNLEAHVRQVSASTKPVACIPMGVSETQIGIRQVSSSLRKSSISSEPRFLVGYAGSLGISNAMETLFSCAELMGSNSSVHFAVMGDGQLRDGYQRRWGHLRNVTFLDAVPRSEVCSFLESCDLLYFATKGSRVWDYGLSLNKLTDYMLSGKPILGSYSGFPSMVNEAGCGSFVPAGDVEALKVEILRYQAMPTNEREALGVRGRLWITQHRGYQRLAMTYLQLLLPGQSSLLP